MFGMNAETGLSSVGRRKVNNMIVNVHEQPSGSQYDTLRHPSHANTMKSEEYLSTRRVLLDQLSHYINKKGIFEDGVTWERSRNNASPEWFWTDFEQDAAILSRLAKCVLLYIPQVESASVFSNALMTQFARRIPAAQLCQMTSSNGVNYVTTFSITTESIPMLATKHKHNPNGICGSVVKDVNNRMDLVHHGKRFSVISKRSQKLCSSFKDYKR
ncbi:unnamed protein product [Albugo candida]|uniref:Uncharacterized protein n=1 Tax=Albugo candida TaxID=65357 RepID=A0A024FXJ8_9STRA|nr:unnamed protein product [Albugo candida]|eukprot:CCI11751.1 unnamed protein product [Albugo candida]